MYKLDHAIELLQAVQKELPDNSTMKLQDIVDVFTNDIECLHFDINQEIKVSRNYIAEYKDANLLSVIAATDNYILGLLKVQRFINKHASLRQGVQEDE